MNFDRFIDLIRQDNARYAEALEALLGIADVACDGPDTLPSGEGGGPEPVAAPPDDAPE